MKKTIFTTTAIAMAASMLAGCAGTGVPAMSAKATQNIATATKAVAANSNNRISTRVLNEPYISATAVDYVPATAGNITLSVGDADVYSVIYGIADQGKYSVTVTNAVDPKRKVSVDIRNLTIDQAIKEVAMSAGYVAVIDANRKMVTLTDLATYTFRLPSTLFQDMDGSFSVSSNPGGGGSGGSGSSAGAGGTSYTVKGTSKGNSLASLKEFLTSMSDAKVHIHPESGLVSVRAPAQQLRRVGDFMNNYVKDVMSQVEIRASFVEVNLTDTFEFGIDWKKVLSGSTSGITQIGLAMGQAASPTLTATYTDNTIQSVVRALEQYTEVRVLTESSAMALNHTPTVLYDGQQIPYLGSVTSNVTGTTGVVSTSGQLSYAMDGISIGFRPNIIDSSKVELSMVPLISTVNGFSEFTVSGNTLRAPNQPIRQSHLQVLAENGKTMIIGGMRSGREKADNSGIPGMPSNPVGQFFGGRATAGSHKEMVIMIQANIIPAPKYNPLVGESI